MEDLKRFIARNKDIYVRHSDVSEEMISKYEQMFRGKFPKELVWIWRNMGFGVYENGYLQIVNPEEYDFVFDYIDKLLEPTIVWGITALGDLLLWEGNDNWTIAPDEGNRGAFMNIRFLKKEITGSDPSVYLDILILEYTSSDFPYWVSCRLYDAYGKEWLFEEKLSIVSCKAKITSFPCKGFIRGKIISEQNDMVEFCTKEPDGVESIDGCNIFWIAKNQLIDNKQQTD